MAELALAHVEPFVTAPRDVGSVPEERNRDAVGRRGRLRSRGLVAATTTLASGLAAILSVLWLLAPPHVEVPERIDWLFPRVRLVRPGEAPTVPQTVQVRSGRIHSIGQPDAFPPPGETETPVARALEGRFVTPGLVDLHVHFPPRVAVGQARLWSLLFLAHGVTSVRELGSIDGTVFEVRQAIADGAFPGPRVFACGEVIDGDPPSFPSNRVVRTPEEARRAVAEQHARGARCIKVYNALGAAELAAVREEAARRGLPVVGHKPHSVPLEDAGVAELQHGTGIPLVDPERVGLEDFRFEDWVEMDDARVERAVEIHREQGLVQTLTLVNSRMRRRLAEPGRRDADSGLRHLPRFWEGVWATLWSPPWTAGDSAGRAVFERFRERQREVARRLILSGVELRAGTDTLMPYVAPGSSLHGELHELAEVGLGPAGAWRAATARAGRALGVEGLGRIAVGAPADLLFFREDPTRDLAALATLEAVLVEGRLYTRADLDAALAIYDAHFLGALYEGVMGLVARSIRSAYAPAGRAAPTPPT